MAYEVSTPVFEGPFDLLLHLITRDQLDIYEISLSSIVDAYVATMEEMRQLDLNVATEFLLTAAILLELKTRGLLPDPIDVDLDEELALWEERDLLLARLLECKTFKDVAVAITGLMDAACRSWPRLGGVEEPFLNAAPDLMAGVTPERLRQAFIRACTPKPVPTVSLDHVSPPRVTVKEAMEELSYILPRMGRATFRRLTSGVGDRAGVIVRFLALLELYKRGAVDLEQIISFGDLTVTWLGPAGDLEDVEEAGAFELDDVEEYQG
jgi:segregation and condensation protein A